MSSSSVSPASYRGRFAPSPTGPLHFGSMVSAVASYLQAKSQNGSWLVRIEDIDPPREVPGSSDSILQTLQHHGLQWDEPVLYQSQHLDRYQEILDSLREQSRLYFCQCSRKTITAAQQSLGLSVYPGTCRDLDIDSGNNTAIRVMVEDRTIVFNDLIQGSYQQALAVDVGDFVLRRSDGLIAYQLAVVADDAYQQITEVVRGYDLLDNTPRQILLQQYLSLASPDYAHHPLATNQSGEKLSKQSFAEPIDSRKAITNILKVLDFLGQNPPAADDFASLEDLWNWATQHWDIQRVPRQTAISVTD